MPFVPVPQVGHGLDIEGTPLVPHASVVFDPAELAGRLEWHAARVAADLAKLPPIHGTNGQGRQPHKGKPKACRSPEGALIQNRRDRCPDGRQWDELRLVSCANCLMPLLGPSEEPARRELTKRSKRALPPPVCGRDRYGAPLCGRCFGRTKARAA
jgi:hypothetical protein